MSSISYIHSLIDYQNKLLCKLVFWLFLRYLVLKPQLQCLFTQQYYFVVQKLTELSSSLCLNVWTWPVLIPTVLSLLGTARDWSTLQSHGMILIPSSEEWSQNMKKPRKKNLCPHHQRKDQVKVNQGSGQCQTVYMDNNSLMREDIISLFFNLIFLVHVFYYAWQVVSGLVGKEFWSSLTCISLKTRSTPLFLTLCKF